MSDDKPLEMIAPEMTSDEFLVRCPICRRERLVPRQAGATGTSPSRIKYPCACGLELSVEDHEAVAMNAREGQTFARIRASRARTFLYRLVNLRDEDEAIEHFVKLFPEFFPTDYPATCWVAEQIANDWARQTRNDYPHRRAIALAGLKPIQRFLRAVWGNADRDTKEWRLFTARRLAWRLVLHPSVPVKALKKMDAYLPPKDALQQALLYLRSRYRLARICAKQGCATKYFFAKEPNQQYCSTDCFDEALREKKRNWWTTNRGRDAKRRKGRRAPKTR